MKYLQFCKENFYMQESINLRIMSSDKIVAKNDAEYVLVPNVVGTLKILPNHCNYTTILSKGKILYKENGKEEENSIDIKGGVCSFINDKLEILVDL